MIAPTRAALLLAGGVMASSIALGLVQSVSIWRRPPLPSMDSLGLARRHVTAGEWGAAAAEYRAAYFVNWRGRGNLDALLGALERAGDQAQVVEVLQRAAAIDRNPEVHGRLAAELLRAGRKDEALAAADRLVELYPDSATAHLVRARLFSTLKRYDLARPSLEKAVELDPTLADAWFGLGISRLAAGAFDAALESFRRALEIAPKMTGAQNGVGMVHLNRGEYAAARRAFETALAIDPDDPGTRKNLERVDALLRERRLGAP